jgi:hypothetical protein
MYTNIRWQQRFQNFEKAYIVFQRRITEYRETNESEANQMSLIQAFEVLIVVLAERQYIRLNPLRLSFCEYLLRPKC